MESKKKVELPNSYASKYSVAEIKVISKNNIHFFKT
jgi:hypothetical protein